MDGRPNNPDMISLDFQHGGGNDKGKADGISARSRANALAASGSVAHWTVLGVGGFASGATILGIGLAFLPPLIVPGAVLGLIGSSFLGLSALRQAPIASHLWRFGNRVLAVATTAGLAAGAGALLLGLSGLALVAQGFVTSVGSGAFGQLMMKLVQIGGGTAVIGAVLGLTLHALHRLTERTAEAF